MTTPQFNGVVQRPEVAVVYEETCTSTRHEEATRPLWYVILQLELPTTNGFYRQSAPAPVEFFCFSGEEQHALLLVEMRLGTKGNPAAPRNSEDLILRHCMEYLAAHPDRTSIYAMVCAGTRARVWTVEKDKGTLTKLDEAWNGDDFYANAKFDDLGLLGKAFEEIKRSKQVNHPGGPRSFLGKHGAEPNRSELTSPLRVGAGPEAMLVSSLV